MDESRVISSDSNIASQKLNQTAAGLVFLHKNLVEGLPWYMLIPVALAITFRGVDDWNGILVWGFIFYLITIPRYFVSLRYSRKDLPKNQKELSNWRFWVIAPALLSGVLWGASPFVFFDLGAAYQQLVLLTIINGACLMAVLLSTYCLPAFVGFILPAMSGEFLFFVFVADSRYRVIGLLPLIMVVVLLKIAQNTRSQTRKSEQLKIENQLLVENLTREKERAETANRAKTQFLAAANHDLRQPVHSLTLLAEALKNNSTDPETLNLVSHIGDSVESLDFVLTALLDISRLEADVVKVDKMSVRIKPLIQALYDEFEPMATAKNIKFKLRVCDCLVYSDPIHLSKILRNLIANSIQFTDKGGILLAARQRGDQVILQVWDTGYGIPNDELEDVFTEFYQRQNKERTSGKGLGLGLSICRRLAELLDHKLSLRSKYGTGSLFEVELPWLESEKLVTVVSTTPVSAFPLKGRRVLVVDNEDSILQGTLAVLHRWGCVVDTAETFENAVAYLEQGRAYDLYLVDYKLGASGNGAELLENFKRLDGGLVPGIIMTGNTSPEFIRTTIDAGYTLLHKPVKPAALRALMARLGSSTPTGGSGSDAQSAG